MKIANKHFIFFYLFCSLVSAILVGLFFSKIFYSSSDNSSIFASVFFIILFLLLSAFFLISTIGLVCVNLIEKKYDCSSFLMGIFYLQSRIEKAQPKKGILAPEMILKQFLQQVRLYASEKSYYLQKRERTTEPSSQTSNDVALRHFHMGSNMQEAMLKRRWNDVQDSIEELDIYLSKTPQDIIAKMTEPSAQHNIDVSHIFRESAETAETTWRPKGVLIEHAIVVPLRANINEKLLKRLLAGPWRACGYFAKRGHGVVFSAKSEKNKIVARWECHGVTFPDKFFEIVKNKHLSVDERVEACMLLITNNPETSNILLALISLVIWNDLASETKMDFNIKQGNDGLNILLKI